MSQWYRASAVGLEVVPVNTYGAVDTSERVRAEWMSVMRCAACDAEKEKEKEKSVGFVGPF